MDSLCHFPLGARFPDSPHAVISSLPTMADVCGYEEGDPEVMSALKSGYPRFVQHEYVGRLIEFYREREGLSGQKIVLIPSRRAADDLLGWLGGGFEKLQVEEAVYLVFCQASDPVRSHRLVKFVQHTGCGISSRQAEDLLLAHGLLESRFSELSFLGNALTAVESNLAEQIGCRESDVLVCASGMNAFYAGFRAVQELQRGRGRTAWVQLGWLYLDSGCVLQEFLSEAETLECIYDVFDVEAFLSRIYALGDQLAAVVVECPSNPLVQICDLRRIAAAVREQGGVMVVDPTIASVYNVDVLPYADLLVTSLTKYAAIEGDVMLGAVALNPESDFYPDLVLRSSAFYVPAYGRDLARLAHEMKAAPQTIERMNANAARLCAFLKEHPGVKKIYCASCAEHIREITKQDRPVGVVITIELSGDMEKFYDAFIGMKGPSFGARFTLICPFMYLAHYDLVTTEAGRTHLASAGINPELIRISVGEEDYDAIQARVEDALNQSIPDFN
ncbi:MAG: PLP-dependent transferase [Opitutales bacterium]